MNTKSLFHYTKNLDNLRSIIANGFRPCYSPELFLAGHEDIVPFLKRVGGDAMIADFAEKFKTVALPMVCFCDIKLKDTAEHTSFYGEYSIAIKKIYATSLSVSPVIYKWNNSAISHLFNVLFQGAMYSEKHIKDEKHGKVFSQFDETILDLLGFVKPVQGKMWDWEKKDFIGRNKIFYNEREWRYMPPIRSNARKQGDTEPEMIINKFITKENLKILNEGLQKKYTLEIKLDDIDYIITADSSERELISQDIEKLQIERKQLFHGLILTQAELRDNFY